MKTFVKVTVCIFLFVAGLNSWANSFPGNNVSIFNQSGDSTGHRAFQISLVPYFGTNGISDSIVNDISINILAGYVYEVRSLEIGGMFNIVKRNMQSCQLAGMGNVVFGKASGLQAAGIVNISNSLDGVQIAGMLNTVRHLKGIQISGLVNHTLTGCGIQMASLINNACDSSEFQISGFINNAALAKQFQISGMLNNVRETEFQIAGLVNNARMARQFQISGLLNNTSSPTNMQIAGLVNNASDIKSTQISGFVNNANTVNGLQAAGFLNRARNLKGVQIGFINIADSCSGVPIGILNFVKNGYHKLELSSDEMFYTNIAYRSGIQKIHGIVSAGIRPDNFDKPLWTYGVGVGTSFNLSPKMLFDMDIMFQNVIKSHEIADNFLYKIYAGADWQLFPKASLFFGVSYNFLVTDTRDEHYSTHYADIAPYTFTDHTYRRFNLKTWAGFRAGIRLF
ncbi:MAG TPA: hypothetical protein VHO72_09805 [Bacteroidales bacterium]|nr:hypothetical protein [Bacteroidales bacterium]